MGRLIRDAAAEFSLRGGGDRDLAQAGAPEGTELEKLLEHLAQRIIAKRTIVPAAQPHRKQVNMSRFPDHCRFAFTIVDDTDNCTLDNIGPVYRLLAELGFRTTKTVWSLPNVPGGSFGGCTLQDPAYRMFIRKLSEQEFEIGMHNVRNWHSVQSGAHSLASVGVV
jgi:hypothetical protein